MLKDKEGFELFAQKMSFGSILFTIYKKVFSHYFKTSRLFSLKFLKILETMKFERSSPGQDYFFQKDFKHRKGSS